MSREVDFTPEQLDSLSQIASYRGTNAVQLVKYAALRIVEDDEYFLEAVERGIEQTDRGVHRGRGNGCPHCADVPTLMRLRWLLQAAQDLENIENYLKEHQP